MDTLSVVLATYNEEENIGKCLAAVKELADEIVIVDGTSKDRTVEISKEYGAKVTVTTNPENFHINKQKAIDLASKDWILQLDADEIVSPELAQEIKSILEKKSEIAGYWLPRKNWFLGRFLMKGGQYPDYTLRLYRRGKGRLPQKDVHEQAVVDGKVGYTQEALLHYPYKNFSVYLNKWRRYVNFTAAQLKEKKADKSIVEAIRYLLVLPIYWFLMMFLRHKGFMDLWQGFVFAFYSALRYPASYLAALRHSS